MTKEEVADFIDEIPIFTFLASQAIGITKLVGAEEQKVKESDRLDVMKNFILELGGKIEVYDDGFEITGIQDLQDGFIKGWWEWMEWKWMLIVYYSVKVLSFLNCGFL